jgi:hypothetical protein
MLQIAVEFPALALAIIENRPPLEDYMSAKLKPDSPTNRAVNNQIVFKKWDESERISLEALALVEAGAPLKTIAALMHVPMAFRKVKPGAADWALHTANALYDQRLVHAHMPDSLPRMKLWLASINLAKGLGPEFVGWVAKHSLEIAGSPSEVLNHLSDLTDWIRACRRASIPSRILEEDSFSDLRSVSCGEQFVVRPFSADMSLKTVTKLSSDWHEAVANSMFGPNSTFPEPWCSAGECGGYEIVPISTSADLYREGKALHHCVGTQGDRVHHGEAYFYSICKQRERVATLELLRHGAGAAIGQLRGPCNVQVSKEIIHAVKGWLRSQRNISFPKPLAAAGVFDGEIPF